MSRVETYAFDDEFISRLKEFLASVEFRQAANKSKSDYWAENAKLINISISGNRVSIGGKSGFYIPARRGYKRYYQLLKRALDSPFEFFSAVQSKLGIDRRKIRLMNHFEAFDFLMNSKWNGSPYWMNYQEIITKSGAFKNVNDIRKS